MNMRVIIIMLLFYNSALSESLACDNVLSNMVQELRVSSELAGNSVITDRFLSFFETANGDAANALNNIVSKADGWLFVFMRHSWNDLTYHCGIAYWNDDAENIRFLDLGSSKHIAVNTHQATIVRNHYKFLSSIDGRFVKIGDDSDGINGLYVIAVGNSNSHDMSVISMDVFDYKYFVAFIHQNPAYDACKESKKTAYQQCSQSLTLYDAIICSGTINALFYSFLVTNPDEYTYNQRSYGWFDSEREFNEVMDPCWDAKIDISTACSEHDAETSGTVTTNKFQNPNKNGEEPCQSHN